MKCKNCNKEIPDDSNFCEHCGINIKTSFGQYIFFTIYALFLVLISFNFSFMLLALLTSIIARLIYRDSQFFRLLFIVTLIVTGVFIYFFKI